MPRVQLSLALSFAGLGSKCATLKGAVRKKGGNNTGETEGKVEKDKQRTGKGGGRKGANDGKERWEEGPLEIVTILRIWREKTKGRGEQDPPGRK